jgi:hypothetical protein
MTYNADRHNTISWRELGAWLEEHKNDTKPLFEHPSQIKVIK